jgi:hypothetical protein
MEFQDLTVKELRDAARHFDPEQRKAGSIAHSGNKEQLIALLQQRGIMPSEAKEASKGHQVEAPKPVERDVFGNPVVSDTPNLDAIDVEIVEYDENPNSTPIQPVPAELPAPKPANLPNPQDDELELIRKIITKHVSNTVNPDEVNAIVELRLQSFVEDFRKQTVRVIEVKQPDELPNRVVGACHYLTEQIAQVCNLGIHQMLVGPAGGGKTTCCEKVAEILNLKFYPMSVGPQTTKSDLLGFIDAAGNYHTTPLREAFANGGLLLLDEVDAANAGVLTIINALLANGYCSFPDGVIQKNENFRCICACNTYGRGADRQYVGRNQLDAATLDRFAVVDFEYDDNLERAIAGNNKWVDKVQKYRKKAFDLKMRVVISPRASIFGAKLLASGMKESLVEELTIWKGVSEEIRSKIKA